MNSIKWKKVLQDFKSHQSRYLMILGSLSISLFAVTTILSVYSILLQNVSASYRETYPAHATFEVENMDNRLLTELQSLDYVEQAEMRSDLLLQVQDSQGQWFGIRFFVIEDFTQMGLSRVFWESGEWPPGVGSILFERTVPELLNIQEGEMVTIKTEQGERLDLPLTGIVHDPSLSPSWQEKTAYAYVTVETMELLSGSREMHDLKVLYAGENLSHGEVKRLSRELSEFLYERGVVLGEIQVPPPYRHPHQGQMEAILNLFLIFGILSLILSSVLTANMISVIMAKENPQIGILKTLGASTMQILKLYLSSVFLLASSSLILGIIPGMVAGKALAGIISGLLNFSVGETAVRPLAYLLPLGAGLLFPVLFSLIPLLKHSRGTVQEALEDHGVSTLGSHRKKAHSLGGMPPSIQMVFRNTFRKKRRLLLSVLLLFTAGGLFLSARNVDEAWKQKIRQSMGNRKWDLQIRLAQPADNELLDSLLDQYPGVEGFFLHGMTTTVPYTGENLRISETYPDGGHGVFNLTAIPAGADLFQYPLLSGSPIEDLRNGAVILNQRALALFPGTHVGDSLSLMVGEEGYEMILQGVVEEIGPAAAYISYENFQAITDSTGQSNAILLEYSNQIQKESLFLATLERELLASGVAVQAMVPESLFQEAVNDHIYIIIYALLAMGIIMALVGALGLSSSMVSNVIERKGELGIMRALGGSNKTILLTVIFEALVIAIISFIFALLVSWPLSGFLGRFLGEMAFKVPLSVYLSSRGIITWSILLFAGTIVASLFPASMAMGVTIRENLM